MELFNFARFRCCRSFSWMALSHVMPRANSELNSTDNRTKQQQPRKKETNPKSEKKFAASNISNECNNFALSAPVFRVFFFILFSTFFWFVYSALARVVYAQRLRLCTFLHEKSLFTHKAICSYNVSVFVPMNGIARNSAGLVPLFRSVSFWSVVFPSCSFRMIGMVWMEQP